MATKSNRSFVNGNQTPEQIQREFIQKPLDGAKQTLMGTGLDLFNLLSALPDAFIASQRRELKRVEATASEKDDERIAILQASIVQAGQLRTMIQHGEARVQRVIGSVAHGDDAFHGFVSNAELEPVAGLTVRLTGREGATGKRGLSGTTDKDGYFRIPLSSKRDTTSEWSAKAAKMSFAERLDSFSAKAETDANATSTSDSSGTSQKRLAQVEILQKDQVVLTDKFALPVDEGSVYREYVVAVKSSESVKSHDVFTADVSDKETINLSENIAAEKAPAKKAAAKKATKRATKK